MKKIVLFGGGTGISQVLKGLKLFPVEVTAIISVSDNGSSTGKLKEEFDMPAIGDVAKVIISMANVDKDFQELLKYRFDKGSLNTHPIKNLLLAALYNTKGNLTDATEALCKILNINGTILPISEDKIELIGITEDSKRIIGEENITKCSEKIQNITYNKKVNVNPKIYEKIDEADLIIFTPGSLYTSILPHLIIPEVTKAIENSHAKKMYVCNILTQPGETDSFKVSDHLKTINSNFSKNILDVVLANSQKLSSKIAKRYETLEGKDPVILDKDKIDIELIADKLYVIETDVIRHDSLKTAYHIFSYLMRNN